ncbi:hypothetical protein Tco_1358206 [Tanacetum coccineum]
MHPFNPSCEIANSSICIFPRVKFSPHDPVVHHSGHDIKRRVKINGSLEILKGLGHSLGTYGRGTNPSDSSIEFNFCTCSVAIEAKGSGCGLELVFLRLPSSYSMSGSLTWDSSGCLGWIVMALIELWSCVEHCGTIVGFFGVEVTKLTTGRLVNGSSCDGIDMVIKDLDLEPKDIVSEFYGPSRWKELSKESGSKILPCGDGSCWKTFKLIASLIA